MRIERLQVTNHERWGRLVKTWATGTNYLDDDNDYPLPTTMDEFKEQLAKAQVFATVPERFTQIKFVSSDQETILVRFDLSAAAVLQAPVQRPRSGDPGGGEVPGARRAHRRLHHQHLRLSIDRFRPFVEYSPREDLRRSRRGAGSAGAHRR